MNVSLLRKRYSTPIIPFLLLLLFYSGVVQATPACPIVTQSFQNSANGATSDPSATGWSLDASHVPNAVYFAAKSHRLKAQTLGGEGVWYSRVFSIAGYTNVQVDAKISSEGTFTSSEYVKVYYKLDGGPETLISAQYGNFGTPTVKSPMMTGSTVQLVIRIYNVSVGNNDYYIENYDVFKEKGPCTVSGISVTASATNSGVLTCTNPTTTLTANTTATGTTTYSWTGPNGYTATGSSVSVSTAGTYTVTGANPAGTGSASVTVTANNSAPDLTATGANMACASSVVVNASSSVPGATYSWTGPNGFTSTAQNPSVTAAGTYTVTVRNPTTGCTASQSVTVTSGAISLWLEDFTLANGTTSDAGPTKWSVVSTPSGSVFSVQNNEFRVSNTGTTSESVWASGTIDISGKTNVTLSAGVRSSVTGSGAMNTSGTYMDYLRFYYKINGGSEVLFSEKLGAINNYSTTNTTISVGSLSGSNIQIIVRARATGSDEFYYFDNVQVSGQAGINATASANGILTCTNTSVVLNGSSSTSGVTYSWTGPGGFTSTAQNPTVSTGGIYTLTVSSAGCTASDTALVSQNITVPDITATGGALACLPNTTLAVSSTVSGATYSWTGPGGFTSTAQNPTVSTIGTYTATVTNPTNGCTASQSVAVTTGPAPLWLEDFTLANGTTSDAGTTKWSVVSTPSGSVFSVQNNEFRVSNTGSGTGTESVWASDTINIAGKTNVSISAGIRSSVTGSAVMNTSGTYMDYLRFYYKIDGGSEVLFSESLAAINNHSTTNTTISVGSLSGNKIQIIVRARATGSDEFYYFDNVQVSGQASINATASANGILTCTNTSVVLNGSSSTSGVTYSWTGPGGFTSTAQNPTVSAAGVYTLTVTNSTGCTGTDTANVFQNIAAPANIGTTSVPASGQLDCTASNVTLTGSSSTTGVSYSWSGPGGFSANAAVATAIIPGSYVLTVTDPSDGCSSTATATVTQNLDPPGSVTATPSNQLTCAQGTATLTGNSTTPGATYAWSGPGGFTSSLRITSTTVAGPYSLMVTNPANGCTATKSITVQQNKTAPQGVSIAPPDQLNCNVTSVTLSGTSSTPNVQYIWSGPNDFSDAAPVTTVTAPGDYTLTVVNQTNGCSSTATVTVIQDLTGCGAMARKVSNGKATSMLTTGAGVNAPVAGFTYKVYPNPVSNAASVDLSSPVSAHAEVGVYNSMGIQEQLLFNGTLEPNRGYKLTINAGDFAMGIHFCIIRLEGKVYSAKLLFTPGRP